MTAVRAKKETIGATQFIAISIGFCPPSAETLLCSLSEVQFFRCGFNCDPVQYIVHVSLQFIKL
jgi:hypothetical protein